MKCTIGVHLYVERSRFTTNHKEPDMWLFSQFVIGFAIFSLLGAIGFGAWYTSIYEPKRSKKQSKTQANSTNSQ